MGNGFMGTLLKTSGSYFDRK